jgi:hypothetical protein
MINKFLQESAPTNPHDIVVKNKYYPQGLREVDIYSYYLNNQDRILKWIAGRRVAFRIAIDERSSVIRRKIKGSPKMSNSQHLPTTLLLILMSVLISH